MSGAKHTPGEWEFETPMPSRREPADAEPSSFFVYANSERGGLVCNVYNDKAHGKANARLIAAAPELLSVAEAIAAKGSGCEDCQECRAGDIWWDARAAIAKATGGES